MSEDKAPKTTAVKGCTCEHSYQDERYGKGRRVHNATMTTPVTYRCTVCSAVKA